MRRKAPEPRLAPPDGPLRLMWRMYRSGLPLVDRHLAGWRQRIETIPDPELRNQAIASISTKTFHCQGGAVYATLVPEATPELVELIVAFQTISDYLDNLCDRSTSMDERDFRLLHQSMIDAVSPDQPIAPNYYLFRKEQHDGGYLHALVQTCRRILSGFPNYLIVSEKVKRWVGLYADLQVYKHLDWSVRETRLNAWWLGHCEEFPDLRWNEFAAATGSTLGVFLMFALSAVPGNLPVNTDAQANAYFPWMCGLHILLDYLIDQEEDRQGGDLNFCSYYNSEEEMIARFEWMIGQTQHALPDDPLLTFHRMTVEGLLAVYLSDPKVSGQLSLEPVRRQLMKGSPMIRMFFWLNSLWVRATHPQIRFG